MAEQSTVMNIDDDGNGNGSSLKSRNVVPAPETKATPWVEKYRPQSLADVAAHRDIIETIDRLTNENRLPHLLLYGPPGTGKTSTILAVARKLYGAHYHNMILELNASDARGIDVVRQRIQDFASTQSFSFRVFSRGETSQDFRMTKNLEGRVGGCLLIALLFAISSVSATIFFPISDSHRSAALEVFSPVDGSFQSLEAAYEALKTFDILGIQKSLDLTAGTCSLVEKTLRSSSSTPKDLYDALRVNGLLKCEIPDGVYEVITLMLLNSVKEATSLLDFHYSVGSLVLVKDQTSKDVLLDDAVGIFRSIKALSQSDGRWRYSSNNPESSTLAAGIAFETLSGVAALSSSEIDDSLINKLEKDVTKLFDIIEKYDDGAFYFDEKVIDLQEHQGPLSTTSSVVRGITSFAAITSGSLNLPGDKILGLANFFLGIGTAGNAKDFFNQIDSLARLESNRISVPLILSLPSSVLSLTRQDQLKVRVNTVLGSSAPPLTVKLIGAYSTSSKAAPVIENQELKSDAESGVYLLDVLPKTVDVGNYVFTFEVLLHDPDHQKLYVTGGQSEVLVLVTGVINIDNAVIAVLDTDLGSIETEEKLNLAEEKAISLSANHLQKLRFSFQLTTPLGQAFKPHQALLKLRHETKVEHIFVVKGSGKKHEILLDFLGLVDKLYYLSGRYDIELSIGDAVMENSFSRALGSVELDLPEAPEKASRPPPKALDPYLRYGPKAEISHIFRTPDKRPAQELSLAFLVFTLMPFLGFLVGLLLLGVNLKNFPTSVVPSVFAILFHGGIAAVLLLYVLFWLKLDLFTTLKSLGFLGVFLLFVGHRILSHLAATSSKLKSA